MELHFKDSFNHHDLHALGLVIEYVLTNAKSPTIEEKIMIASLGEVHLNIRRKLVEWKQHYKFTFTAPQALALRLLCMKYFPKSKAGDKKVEGSLITKLSNICFAIDKQYNITK